MNLSLDKFTWERARFGNVVAASKTTVDPTDGSVDRYIAGEHMDTDDLQIRRWGEIGDGYLGPAFHRKFVAGQILYGSRRTYLRKVAVAEFNGVTANTTFVVETADRDRLLQDFLPWIMTSERFHAYAVQESKGSVNPYINFSDLAKFEFALPPLPEQRRLADLLWSAEHHRRALVHERDRMAGLATDLFDDLGAASSKEELSLWVERIEAGSSPLARPEPVEDGELGVLKVSAVGHDGFVESENKALIRESDFRPNVAVQAGDLLITRANAIVANVARGCIADRDYPHLMLSDKTLRLVPRTGIAPRVILAALQASAYRQHVRNVVGGTDAKNISQPRVLAGPVPRMDARAHARVQAQLLEIDAARDGLDAELESLERIRLGVLQEVFG